MSTSFELPGDIASKTITTFRNEQSYNGYFLDILKSWLQKAIRRGWVDEAVWVTIEICTIQKQAVITNLVTRLRVIAMEDVGLAFKGVVSVVDKKLAQVIVLDPSTKKRRVPVPVTKEAMVGLADISAFLASCRHVRICSDIKAVFLTCQLEEEEARNTYRNTLVSLFPNVYNDHVKRFFDFLKTKELVDLRALFRQLLLQKDMKAFFVMDCLLTHHESKKNAVIGVMNQMIQCTLKQPELNQELCILLSWLKDGLAKTKDYLLAPLYGGLRIILDGETSASLVEKEYHFEITNFCPNRKVLPVPDVCIDKHTKLGRNKGSSDFDFAKEGAVVCNEAMEFVIPTYREIYIRSKTVMTDNTRPTKKSKKC